MDIVTEESNSQKKWLKVSIHCPGELVDSVSDLLADLSGCGVEIKPLDNDADVTGFFTPDPQNIEKIQGEIIQQLDTLLRLLDHPFIQPRFEAMDDEDWAVSWKRFFKPFAITEGLIIKPSWEEYSPASDEKIIELDPGMAFGTGQHASTKMALDLIRQVFEDDFTVTRAADIGTGTGILAMGAALFGAQRVEATDNDPEATEAAVVNVASNNLSDTITVSDTDLDELSGPFELISANIIHDVLVEMAPKFKKLLAPTGRIVLAGILSGEQEENIITIYTGLGLHLIRAEHQEEWAALLFSTTP